MLSQQLTNLYERTQRLTESDHTTTDEWLELIDMRDEILHQLELSPKISENDKRLIQAIGQFDEEVKRRLNELKEEAALNISRINRTRMQNKMYENTYMPDSYFIDKKK